MWTIRGMISLSLLGIRTSKSTIRSLFSPLSHSSFSHNKHTPILRYKTKKCKHFEKSGKCKFGDSCIFAHGAHELRQAPLSPTTPEGDRPRSDSKKFGDDSISLPVPASKTVTQRRPAKSLNSPSVSESYRKVVDPTSSEPSSNALSQDLMRMVGVNKTPIRKKFHRLYFMPANSIW